MFESLTAVIVLIVFLVPGYIWRTVEGRFVALDRESKWEMLALGFLTRSTIIYLPILPSLYLSWLDKWHEHHPWLTSLLSLLWLILIPTVLGVFTGFGRQKRWLEKFLGWAGLSSFNPIPNAWESYFSQAPNSWIIVTLKNGQRVYGYFGDGSYASSDPKNRDIYVAKTVVVENGQYRLVENTGGVYVPASEILTVEFINEGESGDATRT